MKQIIVTAAAGGCLVMAGPGLASADTRAPGATAGVPGALSGTQAPAATAADVCATTLHTEGLLKPVLGNLCGAKGQRVADRGAADATGTARHSPGMASGNAVQLPVQAPVNACGNTVNILGLLNPAGGGGCRDHLPTPHRPSPPPVHAHTPPPAGTQSPPPPGPPAAQLADTGADGLPIEVPAAVALLSLGALLSHRARRPLSQ